MMSADFYSASAAGIVVAKSSLLLVLGWGAARLQQRAAASIRYAVWLTAVVGVLVIPALNRFSVLSLPVFSAEARSLDARSPMTSNTESELSLQGIIQPATSGPIVRIVANGSSAQLNIGEMIVAGWGIVAALMLLRLVLGVLQVARIVRRSRVIDAAEWTNALSAAAERMDVRPLPRLVMSDEVEMAFAFAAITPVIVLPTNAEEWPDDCRQSVLLHELAHLRRRDLAGRLLSAVASAVHWFNPFMWLTARQLGAESELACDELVLGAGVNPSDYAQHLLDVVTSSGRRTPAVAMAMARPTDFERRVVAILDLSRRRSTSTRRQGVIAAGVVGLSAISIGAVAPAAGGARVERAAGIAFASGGNHVAMAVEAAARRGRLDILTVDSAAPVLRNGINLAPLGARGDYYLFDSTSFVLVRPASKTFAIFGIADAAYNFDNRREGWPTVFEIPTTVRTQSVSPSEGAMRQVERHGAFHVFWHVDADAASPSFTVLSRGRVGVSDAPLGESTIARWFGPALALAQLATIESTWFSNDRLWLTVVAPLVGDNASTTNFISKQRLVQPRTVSIDLSRLTLPSDYTVVLIAGSMNESQAKVRIDAWRTAPRAR